MTIHAHETKHGLSEILRIAAALVGIELPTGEAPSVADEYAHDIASAAACLQRAAELVERHGAARIGVARTSTPLTPREREIARLLARGRSYKEIATALDITTSTAQSRVKSIYAKLGVHSKSELAHRLAGTAA